MYRKTFETIAKYFAKTANVTIQFDTEGGASADMKSNVLHLPKKISSENGYAALALAMHEAAHIKYSKMIPMEQLVDTEFDKAILNAMEDVRIDIKNFNKLPNIKEFYKKLIEDETDLSKASSREVCMICESILNLEGFRAKKRRPDVKKGEVSQLNSLMSQGVYCIERKDWTNYKKIRDEIKKFLNIDPKKDPPVPKEQMVMGSAGQGQGDGQGKGKGIQAEIEGITKNQDCLKAGQGDMEGGSNENFSPTALEEQTVQQFKELLNIKETKTSDNGLELDTDSLVSFYTHDINELFKEEKIVKKKKSKIYFLMDGSGSMSSALLDGTESFRIVASCVKSLTNILDELRHSGMEIDWDVGMFRGHLHRLNKENWEQRYGPGGGTHFEGPFKEVVDEMLKDYTIEGKRIIVVMTDGEIYESEVTNVVEYMQGKAKDIRPLFIGIGTAFDSFTRNLIGDNVIVDRGTADFILCKAIEELL